MIYTCICILVCLKKSHTKNMRTNSKVTRTLMPINKGIFLCIFRSSVAAKLVVGRGRSRKIEKEGGGDPDACEAWPMGHAPPRPGTIFAFLFSEVAYSAFSGKNSAQNLINYKVINSNDKLLSVSTDPLNILRECCYTNLLMISFNYMSTKGGGGGGGSGPPGPTPGSAPELHSEWRNAMSVC